MKISAFNQMIASRRSIYPRDYKNEKIEDEIIWQILNNAHWAPTHKMTVPWRFKVYAGKGREELGRKQAEIYKKVALEEGNFLTVEPSIRYLLSFLVCLQPSQQGPCD